MSNIPACPGYDAPGAEISIYLAPEGWTGECISPWTIPGETLITLIILPTRVTPCAPRVGSGAMSSDVRWTTLARACDAVDLPADVDVPPGFSRCVHHTGEEPTCPPSFPERKVFHGDAETSLVCSPCTCGPPEGSVCNIWALAHYHSSCSGLTDSHYTTLEGGCGVYTSGLNDLYSIQAIPHTFEPGTCAPQGGEPQGHATPSDPTTFCCERPEAPP